MFCKDQQQWETIQRREGEGLLQVFGEERGKGGGGGRGGEGEGEREEEGLGRGGGRRVGGERREGREKGGGRGLRVAVSHAAADNPSKEIQVSLSFVVKQPLLVTLCKNNTASRIMTREPATYNLNSEVAWLVICVSTEKLTTNNSSIFCLQRFKGQHAGPLA